MNTLYGLTQSKQNISTSKTGGNNSWNQALAVFNTLSLKEKCLYLMKISKRNTSRQILVLTGLTLSIIAGEYLFSLII